MSLEIFLIIFFLHNFLLLILLYHVRKRTVLSSVADPDIIGNAAYSEKENIEYTKDENIKLISRLSKTVTHGPSRKAADFEYNKDADMYVFKAGYVSIKKVSTRPNKHAKDGQGIVESYFFDVQKCKNCQYENSCYKDGGKTKSYSISIKTVTPQEHMDFQESEYFKGKTKERYKIEAKNSELKHRQGYDVALSSDLIGMGI